MIGEMQLHLDGVVTFWSSGSFYHRNKLKDGLEALGLGDFAPNHSTYDANLKYALDRVFTQGDLLIRPNKGGFNVIEERMGEKDEANIMVNRYTFWLDGPDHNLLMMQPINHDVSQDVVLKFNEFCGLVTQSAVTRCLVNLVVKLAGVGLRPSGGIYSLPGSSIDLWDKIGAVIEGASAYGKAAVYKIRYRFDADSVRAVRDALITEAEADAERLEKEIMEEELGVKALEHRREQAEAAIDKIATYENILGQTVGGLKERMESIRNSAAIGVLRLSAARMSQGVAS